MSLLAKFYHGTSQCTIGTNNGWGELIWNPKVKLVHMASSYVEL